MDLTRRERARHQLLRRRKQAARAGFVLFAVVVMLIPSLRAPAPTAGSTTADPLWRVRIPAIGFDEAVTEGITQGLVHRSGTPLPGELGNAVLTTGATLSTCSAWRSATRSTSAPARRTPCSGFSRPPTRTSE